MDFLLVLLKPQRLFLDLVLDKNTQCLTKRVLIMNKRIHVL